MIAMLQRDVSLPLAVLLAANLFPLYGVLYLGWGVFELILLFWMENVVIGLFNVLKMATNRSPELSRNPPKGFLVPFFIFHYGGFAFVHGVFVIALFAPTEISKQIGFLDYLDHSNLLLANGLSTALTLLFVSHAVSFYTDYVRSGDYRRTSLQYWMNEPYRRVILLHVGLIGGGILLSSLGQPTTGLILLLFLKIGMDVLSLWRREKRIAIAEQETSYYPQQARKR